MVTMEEKEDGTWEEKERERAAHGMNQRCNRTDCSPCMWYGGHGKCDMREKMGNGVCR